MLQIKRYSSLVYNIILGIKNVIALHSCLNLKERFDDESDTNRQYIGKNFNLSL